MVPYTLCIQLGRYRWRIHIQFCRISSSNFPAVFFHYFLTYVYSFWNKIQIVCTRKICLAAFDRSFKALSNGHRFSYDFIMISLEKVKMNRSIFFSSFFVDFLLFIDMNVFTLLALKSKRIELLSSAWWHFEDFFLLLGSGPEGADDLCFLT